MRSISLPSAPKYGEIKIPFTIPIVYAFCSDEDIAISLSPVKKPFCMVTKSFAMETVGKQNIVKVQIRSFIELLWHASFSCNWYSGYLGQLLLLNNLSLGYEVALLDYQFGIAALLEHHLLIAASEDYFVALGLFVK